MEPASLIIDNASDFAEDGKVDEAIAEYRKALAELDRIELENPDRAEKAEFATLRNKRAYVNAAIDSLLLSQARKNASAVAITDTTELEKEYGKLKAAERDAKSGRPRATANDETRLVNEGVAASAQQPAKEVVAVSNAFYQASAPKLDRRTRLKQTMDDVRNRDFDTALTNIRELLEEKPNDAAALNLRASIEAEKGDYMAAERTLDQCIQSNPRSYYAYYNMSRLMLRSRGIDGVESARLYYGRGRELGGPRHEKLEEALK